MRVENLGGGAESNNVAPADLLFGFGCSLAEWLDEGQVLVSGELEDTKQSLSDCVLTQMK